jgi:hypothetical protein
MQEYKMAPIAPGCRRDVGSKLTREITLAALGSSAPPAENAHVANVSP